MSDEAGDAIVRARALADAFLRPRRPRLADALEVVTAIDRAHIERALAGSRWSLELSRDRCELHWAEKEADGSTTSLSERAPGDRVRETREAWESLAARGVIPEEWVGSQARRFARGQFASAPHTLAGAIAIAADPEGIIEAERLAREVASRLVQWGASKSTRPVWWVGGRPEWITQGRPDERDARLPVALPGGGAMHEMLAAIGYSVPVSVETIVRRRAVTRREAPLSPAATEFLTRVWAPDIARPVVNLIRAHEAWAEAVRDRRVVKTTMPGATEGEWVVRTVKASELPDPFEPLFLLLLRGYVLLDLSRRSAALFADATLRAPIVESA